MPFPPAPAAKSATRAASDRRRGMDRRVWLAGLVVAGLAGCGGGKADVTGKVTHQGKAVVSGSVVVRGPDGIDVPGTIQRDGTYTVQGVASGAVKIAVI